MAFQENYKAAFRIIANFSAMKKADVSKFSIKKIINSGSASGFLLLICVIISLIIANSPLANNFANLLDTHFGLETESVHLRYSVLLWINDGLMAIFFLLVGLEIKRELVAGELSSPKKAILPILAALGGVLVPAGIYMLFNHGTLTEKGWAIPMATDIAFAIAIVTMLGSRVPISLKIFLAALAIVDDLMAILVIAFFYSTELNTIYLLYAAGIFCVLLLFNRLGICNLAFYLIPGIFIWYFIHHSGIHATIAGVLVAMTIPLTTRNDSVSPLEKLEHALVVPVSFLIMPLFALANTNITFEQEMIGGLITPLGLGIILGLMLGKPIGISLITYAAVKLNICTMPSKARWIQVVGVGMLAGIGFTMSIFIAVLSFTGEQLLMSEAKFSILMASVLSATAGSILLSKTARKEVPL